LPSLSSNSFGLVIGKLDCASRLTACAVGPRTDGFELGVKGQVAVCPVVDRRSQTQPANDEAATDSGLVELLHPDPPDGPSEISFLALREPRHGVPAISASTSLHTGSTLRLPPST